MKLHTDRRGNYEYPETDQEQRFTYRGYVIEFNPSPIPPYVGCDWQAHNPDEPEEPIMFSGVISDLQAQIDERIEEKVDG